MPEQYEFFNPMPRPPGILVPLASIRADVFSAMPNKRVPKKPIPGKPQAPKPAQKNVVQKKPAPEIAKLRASAF
jgi:hypothetical protein